MHVPVLLEDVIEGLAIHPGGVYLDGTLGAGGHFRAVVDRLDARGIAVGIDRDEQAVSAFDFPQGPHLPRIIVETARYADFDEVLQRNGISGLDGILLDLGVSSMQIDQPERGFTYMKKAPLDMRMDIRNNVTAADILNTADEADLSRVLSGYGEIRNAGRMARAFISFRRKNLFRFSTDIRRCLESEYGSSPRPGLLARVFQALRLEVNRELEQLSEFLEKSGAWLKPAGRIAVISYHSLEDRCVKRFFRDMESSCICPPQAPVCVCNHKPLFKRINRKAVKPTPSEIARNRRSRSARLRVAEKLPGDQDTVVEKRGDRP